MAGEEPTNGMRRKKRSTRGEQEQEVLPQGQEWSNLAWIPLCHGKEQNLSGIKVEDQILTIVRHI